MFVCVCEYIYKYMNIQIHTQTHRGVCMRVHFLQKHKNKKKEDDD